VLARKPGALRNGAPVKNWVLPAVMERVRRKLAAAADGNRQMVGILTAVLTDGLPAPRPSPKAFTPPTWPSTSWPASAIPARQS
jgi:hypothetical protein